MRKYIILIVLSFIVVSVFSQVRDVTRFLDIPIEGNKKEMTNKIKAKGFKKGKSQFGGKVLVGKFNGDDVYVDVQANENNEVYRIVVSYDLRGAQYTKNLFNRLIYQFSNNGKYYVDKRTMSIPETEDISYNLKYGKKSYRARFYQKPTEEVDSIIWGQVQGEWLLNNFLKERNDSLTEEERAQEISKGLEQIYNEKIVDLLSKKVVWFTIIGEERIGYIVAIYYENGYNMENGEDL